MDSIDDLRRQLEYLREEDDRLEQGIAERMYASILEALSELENRVRELEAANPAEYLNP